MSKPSYANVVSKGENTNKKTGGNQGKGKSPKTQKNDFNRLVYELQQEAKSYQTPKHQKLTFLGVAVWIAASPLYLYGAGVFETNLRENILPFALSTVIAAAVVYHMYEVLASQVRHKLLNEKLTELQGKLSNDEEKTVLVQSANYSLFIINILYIVFFLTFIGYFLPPYELSHPIAYGVASITSSLIIATLVSVKLLR